MITNLVTNTLYGTFRSIKVLKKFNYDHKVYQISNLIRFFVSAYKYDLTSISEGQYVDIVNKSEMFILFFYLYTWYILSFGFLLQA